MHCGNFIHRPASRRQLLKGCAMGFGGVALKALMAEQANAAIHNPLDPKIPHFVPKAKNVIFLYMDGGPSQVDTFDYKPHLEKYHGQDPRDAIGELAPTQFDNIGKVLKSQWDFKQRGESGNWVSDLFPHLASDDIIDELAFVKSMTSKFSEHTFANYFLHTGSPFQGRPSMGAWLGYGLGTENENLPGFVVLNGGLIPPGGLDCFGSGFLPASYQGSVFLPQDQPIANIKPGEATADLQKEKLDLIRQLDQHALEASDQDPAVEAAIQNYETAFRMQTSVPDLMDLAGESEVVKKMYGLDADFKNTRTFGLQCLLARRLVQRGVRFIELTCPSGNGDRWDQHKNLFDGHTKNCKTVDQPIAALIRDLRILGLLESTLIVFAGEFGRTPFAQGTDGRDHNPFGFTIWMAGGGVKGGACVGETDEWGYKAVKDRYEIHDLHATMLHLLGVEHTKSTFRFSGRDMRLTDVHGHLIEGILS
ncbi:MAG: sulfatase [Verrucomicrobiales bacterium]|nr:sulfatase [Verrucomicrobiales bacterium]